MSSETTPSQQNDQTSSHKTVFGYDLSQILNYREILDFVSKALVGITSICYVAGLLIENLYLRRYGVFHLSFLQVDYVIIGVTWMFLTTTSFLVLGVMDAIVATPLNLGIIKSAAIKRVVLFIGMALLSIVMIAVFIGMSLWILSDYELPLFSPRTYKAIVSLLVIPLTLRYLKAQITKAIKGHSSKDENKSALMPTKLLDISTGVFWTLTGLILYANCVFPLLLPVYGGGKTQSVMLVVRPDQAATLNTLGFQLWPDGKKVGPLDAVYESQDYLIVVSPKEISPQKDVQAIKIKKDMFDLLFYVKPTVVAPPHLTVSPSPGSSAIPSSSPK